MSQRASSLGTLSKRQSLLSYKKKRKKIACQLTIKIKEVIMAYAVLRCAHAQAQDTQVTVFPLIFFFLVAKGLFEPFFWSDRTNYQLLTRERAGSPGACHQVVYYAKRAHFPLLFTKCEALGRTAELSLLKSKKENKKVLINQWFTESIGDMSFVTY